MLELVEILLPALSLVTVHLKASLGLNGVERVSEQNGNEREANEAHTASFWIM